MIVQFTITGKPTPQKRHRHTKTGFTYFVYDPSSKDKRKFALQALQHSPKQHLENIRLTLNFYFPRPKSHSKKNAPQYHTKRPDVDNCVKFVMDALTTAGFWEDDSQVYQLVATKQYGEPRTEIFIEQVMRTNENN